MSWVIQTAVNSNLKPGLWLIAWDGTIEHFEQVVECFINKRNTKRLKTIHQVVGSIPQKDFDDWMLTRNMEATATYIGTVEDNPEYYL